MALHLDEISVFVRMIFSRKINVFGSAGNITDELATSMQVFLMSSLTGKKVNINLCSKYVTKMNSNYLKDFLFLVSTKANSCGHDIILRIMESTSMSSKLLRNFLRQSDEGDITSIAD